MKFQLNKRTLSLLSASIIAAPTTFADQTSVANGISKALSDSKVNVSFRARYEGVDQDGIAKDADALTLKSRATLKTGAYNGLSFTAEIDNVTALVENYNSTANNKAKYPKVVDPEGSDINQAFLQYTTGKLTATAGRQRILHNNQRFVGGVGWRQNEQTYDGYRAQFNASSALSFDYSYIYNVNRIFGPKGAAADLHGDFHLANASYQLNKDNKLSAFAYLLDFDSSSALSSNTYGILYNAKFGAVNVNASIASQSDAGNNAKNYDATYYNFELATKLNNVTLLAGIEILGSDNGVAAFTTPLATLHKFQGFADKFLATPANGIEDIYITAKTEIANVKLTATYHDLSSNEGSIDYGNELDLVAAYTFTKNYNVLVKFSSYDADDFSTDTNKLWLQLAAKF